MAYRLDLTDAALADALRAVADTQLRNAATALERRWTASPAQAVHDARTSVKKARAALRLARPALDRAAYRRENRALRGAARLLAASRDADVLVATAAALAKRYVGHVPAATFDALTTAFAARAVEQRTAADDGDGPRHEAIAALRAARERARAWPLRGARRATLVAGLGRTYARGRAGLAAVAADPDDVEASHAWRRRVKDLWYQQRLVAPAWPAVLGAQADQAHELATLLGDDHDLALLAIALERGDVPAAADLAPVIDLVAARRAELRERALRLGARVYAEPSKAFERRLRAYLGAWLDEQAAGRRA